MKGGPEQIVVRALQTRQADSIDVYAFFLYGADLCRIADISRVTREGGDLKGFQRREIRNHVKSIVEFLDTGPVLFPNAIILALSPEIEFKFARGSRPDGMIDAADSGTLSIPVRPEGQRVAWIVDGQQRSLALFQTRNTKLPVPVVAFVSDSLETHREQFILVNKARPLPTRLINELLPEVNSRLPRDLAVRRLPSELCNILNKDRASPFHELIRREIRFAGQHRRRNRHRSNRGSAALAAGRCPLGAQRLSRMLRLLEALLLLPHLNCQRREGVAYCSRNLSRFWRKHSCRDRHGPLQFPG